MNNGKIFHFSTSILNLTETNLCPRKRKKNKREKTNQMNVSHLLNWLLFAIKVYITNIYKKSILMYDNLRNFKKREMHFH